MKTSISYKTKQGELIQNWLIENKDKHVTADEIMESLTRERSMVGKTTIYRYLDKLVSQGKVRKYIVEDGLSACYQYVENNDGCHEHYHLKCIECGKLIHLKCNYLNEMNAHILKNHSFMIDNSKTVLYGQCRICASAHEGGF